MTRSTETRSLHRFGEVFVGELRKVTGEREARRLLAAVRKSGQTIGEWARGRGIDGRSLRAWHVNLERRGTTRQQRTKGRPRTRAASRQLVEIVSASRGAARYSVHVGAATVEFGDDFAESTLLRVVAVLRSC
jgi:hypothetical protein